MSVPQAVPSGYINYCQAHPSNPRCEELKNLKELNRTKRSIIPDDVKAIPALHLINLTSLFPVFGEDIHTLAKRSIIYDSRNVKTIKALTYGSPWAVMQSYNPRDAILNVRSLVPAVEREGKDDIDCSKLNILLT